jgi:hypothetical protein
VQGKEWGRKMLYLGLFWVAGFFIPVVPWLFAGGYIASVIRQVKAGDGLADLPEWSDWNRLLMDGIRLLGAWLIYFIPVSLFFSVAFSFYFGTTFAGIGLSESGFGRDLITALIMLTGTAVLFVATAVGMLFSLGLGFIIWPAITHMLVRESFGALFQVKEWWRVLRANLCGYLIAMVILLGLSFTLNILIQVTIYSVILCALLPVLVFVSMPYLSVISAALLGQIYREGADAVQSASVDASD